MRKLDNEKELFINISNGDERSFKTLFNFYIPQLEAFAFKFTRSPSATEEIIQNAFIRLWLNRDKLADIENPRSYLYKYVSNESLNFLRKALNEEKAKMNFSVLQNEFVNSTLENVFAKDVKRIVASSVARMPEQRKRIYEMSRMHGKSIPEIASILNISSNTVKNTLVTALKTIREELSREGIVVSLLVIWGYM